MTDTTITVQGEHISWYAAERATVGASVHAWGAQRDAVFSRAVAAADALRASIEVLFNENAGPVTWWAAESVRVWSERPWNNEGTQIASVFHAALDFSAKFKEFEALARWVESTASLHDASIESITWNLTEATTITARADARSRAVADAIAKATVFAQSIGLTAVRATALADPGMLGDHGGAEPAAPAFAAQRSMKMASLDSGSGSPQLQLKPEQIAVSCLVDARFTAS